jgi:hypothetical protein
MNPLQPQPSLEKRTVEYGRGAFPKTPHLDVNLLTQFRNIWAAFKPPGSRNNALLPQPCRVRLPAASQPSVIRFGFAMSPELRSGWVITGNPGCAEPK